MIENLGNIGDFIGGVGVFVTLVYLATQVRQNTRSHRQASVAQIISTAVNISSNASRGPIPAIFAKCERRDRLTEEEIVQFLLHILAAATNQWQIFDLYQNGTIGKEVLDSFMNRLHGSINVPVARAMWRSRIKDNFPADFQEYIDQQIEHHA